VLGGGVTAAALMAAGVVTDESVAPGRQEPLALSAGIERKAEVGLTAGEIYRRSAPGVVFVQARTVDSEPSPFELYAREQDGISTGSGFVIDDDGLLLTNAHVVTAATDVHVTFSDERTVPAKIVGKDDDTDLALLRVEPGGLDLRPLTLGDSRTVRVGDPTVAIGNPFGLDRTLTTGVVSALQRQIRANQVTIDEVIQTDAAINPGNSGGPLIDVSGRVIGINSQIATTTGASVGIAFAIPVNTAKTVIPELEERGRVSRAYLGIQGRSVDQALSPSGLGTEEGLVVEQVDPLGPAARAGIAGGDPALGTADVIERIDGKPVDGMDDVTSLLQGHEPGDTVKIELRRGDSRRSLEVGLTERPASVPLG
jgi:S1-C subfamily serine protease